MDAVAAGKGFVGFHSTSYTIPSKGSDIDPYLAMLGGEFITHGAPQEASLLFVPPFPGISDLACAEGLSFTDEWYSQKNFPKDLHVILVQETKYLKGDCYRRPDYPSTWARMQGKGRVFYTSLGHFNEELDEPVLPSDQHGRPRLGPGQRPSRREAEPRPGCAAREPVEELRGSIRTPLSRFGRGAGGEGTSIL